MSRKGEFSERIPPAGILTAGANASSLSRASNRHPRDAELADAIPSELSETLNRKARGGADFGATLACEFGMRFVSRPFCEVSPRARLPRLAELERVDGLSFDGAGGDPRFEAFAGENGETKLTMFGGIGDPDGVTLDRVSAALDEAGPDTSLTVQINSYGGDFYVGLSIFNLLRQRSGSVTIQVLGLAASAASVVAMAGDRIEMAGSAELMVHRAQVLAIGNANTMAQAKAALEKIDASMAAVYAARAKSTPAKMLAMMDAETWFNPQEAIAAGLADAEMPVASIGRPTASTAGPKSVRELERGLRSIGCSRAAAARMASAAFPALGGDSDWKGLLDRIEAATANVKRKHAHA